MKGVKYDREFKLNSIKLYRESQKPMIQVCKDLGIPISTFSTWLKEFTENGENSFPGSGKLKPCNEEIYRLKKQLADVTMERDILKKAIAIFSKPKGIN
jgi:transposase-like protein